MTAISEHLVVALSRGGRVLGLWGGVGEVGCVEVDSSRQAGRVWGGVGEQGGVTGERSSRWCSQSWSAGTWRCWRG